jgi:hypothetical protein
MDVGPGVVSSTDRLRHQPETHNNINQNRIISRDGLSADVYYPFALPRALLLA